MPSTSHPPVRVFVADDSTIIRERVAALLDTPDMAVVGEGATPHDCIAGILAAHPDVVVLDHQLEGGNGLDVLRAVHSADPRIAFVVFSNNSGDAYRKRYIAEGATRFLDKATDFEHLAQAVLGAASRPMH